MEKEMKRIARAGVCAAFACILAGGCSTPTRLYGEGEVRPVVAGFSEADIRATTRRALDDLFARDRIKIQVGANRAVMIVEDVVNDTNSRGRDADALATTLGQTLREELTNGGKAVVYNKEAGAYATVKVVPQYRLAGRLTERNLRMDNGDVQREYNLLLTLVDLQTGLEFWQKRVHVGKEVDEDRVLY